MASRHTLALLLSALWALPTLAAPPEKESLRALSLELRFGCPRPATVQLDYFPGTRAVVEVPAGCAGEGTMLLMEVRCGKKWCRGTLFQDSEPVASLKGSRERMRTREVAHGAPLALKSLKVHVLGDAQVAVDVSQRRGTPLEVHVVNGTTTALSRLASGEAGILRWSNPRGEVAIALHLERTGDKEAHLTVVSDKGRTVLNSAFPVGGEREVSCEEAGLDCDGRVRFSVQQPEPTRL